uniref:COesterase domain-containing protein n=1 Tax=Meloidogyne hapla TaxID=6305 RepID=A0A1I8B4P9_MELHA
MDLNNFTASASHSSFWSIFSQYSHSACGKFFSLFDENWIKGRPCSYGITIQTKNGPIIGKTFTLPPDGKKVNAFLGIPYAIAGTFKQRFKDLVWDAYLTPQPQDEAKCLNVSVFSPDWESTEFPKGKRPVMVFVHGGGFVIHSAANYGDWNICQNLCLYDVVVCVVQYRLGMLGFLSTGDDRCPGNFGLWDQLTALKWVKENIATFGGDPDNITAFGQSAGAASIDLLSLSPLSDGLFKRIILMGGNASTDWAIVRPEKTISGALKIARGMNWKGTFPGADSDLDSLLAFLRELPAHELSSPLIGKSAFNRHKKGLEYCPVIDGELITAPVSELRARRAASKNRPPLEVILGATEFEALLFAALGRRQSDIVSLRKYLQIHIPKEIPNFVEIRERCEKLYLDGINRKDSSQMSTAFLRLHSDVMINNSVQRYCKGMLQSTSNSNKTKIFLYNMKHFNPNEFGFVGLRMPFYAATHCHDLRYLVGKGLYSKFRPNIDDKQVMHIIGTLFTNFVKYGNPNSHWRRLEEMKDSKNKKNGYINKQIDNSCCEPWNPSGTPGDEESEFVDANKINTNFGENGEDLISNNFWLPISSNDTYNYFELCLEPKMLPRYQDGRYEFWYNEVDTATDRTINHHSASSS